MNSSIDRENAVLLERNADALVVRIGGRWHLGRGLPSPNVIVSELSGPSPPRALLFLDSGITAWDSGLVAFVAEVSETYRSSGVVVQLGTLPDGVKRLVELAAAVPEKKGDSPAANRPPFLDRVGIWMMNRTRASADGLSFVGDFSIAAARFLTRRARFRRVDLVQEIQGCGASALGIVTLISFLVGVILAFMGAVQLQQFGAAIYVADLVGIGMVREMGAMMTAIIMSGRTGAAFAAQLGTMKVTQETEALITMGISPMEFLVVPRVVALVLMMPLLCIYSDFMGIMGGAFVGVSMLKLSLPVYLRETISTLSATNLLLGIIKATVYGALIGLAGCLRGFQSGNSSAAVGDAATHAVVTSIVLVIVACGVFALITNVLGI